VNRLFIDTSALVALAFEEPGHERVADLMAATEHLFAAPLLEAEFRAALEREETGGGGPLLAALRWVIPDRPLTHELDQIFSVGYLRGADAWHLATALFLVEAAEDLPFLTLDQRQRSLAESLGFPTPL
jgi:predicted nucleic acid-binding protein